GRLRPGGPRGAPGGQRRVLPDPEPPPPLARPVRTGAGASRDGAGGPRGALAAGAPLALAGRAGAHRGGRQRPREGGRLMTLRAGLVGLGVMGRNHARVLGKLEGVEFVAVCDPAPNVPDTVEGHPVVKELDELISLGIDYAVVAAPTVFHLEVGTRLAEAGIHALIEKPVASSAEDSRKLRDLFAEKGLVGGVGHIERYNPALQAARTRIADGMLGEIYQIATRRQGPFPGRIADVGVIKDLASHDIDLTAWVAQQEFVSVNARTTHRSGRPHEDMVVAVGTLAGGTITSHTVNWLTPFKERVTIITGEKGVLVADTLS